MHFTMSDKNARRIAILLQSICFLMTFLVLAVMILVLLGRVEINISSPSGYYERALLLEKDHTVTSRIFLADISDQEVYLHLKENVDFITWLSIALIGITRVLPLGLCFFMLAKFFRNISEGKVFEIANAKVLLKSGTVLMIAFFAVPILCKWAFPQLIRIFSENELQLSFSYNFSYLFFGTILLVMAYVFRYGIYLQDEVDHTL